MDVLQAAGLDLDPRDLGDGLVHLGSLGTHTADVSQTHNLTLLGQAQGVADGDVFTINGVDFEFDSGGGVNTAGALAIPFTRRNTHEEIAQTIVLAD